MYIHNSEHVKISSAAAILFKKTPQTQGHAIAFISGPDQFKLDRSKS